MKFREAPKWTLTFIPEFTAAEVLGKDNKPKVAVIR